MSAERRDALRYLGVRGEPEPSVAALIDECFVALSVATPRHAVRVMPAKDVLALFDSRSLETHLAGCAEAALFAATLGVGADALIRRATAVNTLRAAALHACAAARIEAYCDAAQAQIAGAGRARFSPGYGDFSLSGQRALLNALDAGRRLGLYLTDGGMLVPTKSVTAVIAIGGARQDCARKKCAWCEKTDCAFREEEVR